ncbi:MAG: sensor histidine kinase [Bacteroidia bacterium]
MQILLEFVNANKNPEHREVARQDLERGYRKIPSPNAFDRFYYYDFLCWYSLEEKDLDQALHYADSMKTASADLEDGYQQAAYAGKMRGDVLSRMHRYTEALHELYSAEAMSEEHLDSCTAAEILAQLGTVLYRQGDYRQALFYHKKAHSSAQSCGTEKNATAFALLQSSSNAQGLCYERLNLPDSSRHYYYEALNLLENRQRFFPADSLALLASRAEVVGNLGNVEMESGNLEQAKNHFLFAISIHDQAGKNRESAIGTHLKLARMFVMQKEFTRAAEEFSNIRDQLSQAAFPELERDLFLVESNYYDAISQPEKAYLAFKQHVKIRDSLQLMNGVLPNGTTEVLLAQAVMGEEPASITPQDEEENIYLKGSLVLLFVLLVVIYLIRRNLIESREHVTDLNQLNREIKEQNEQLHAAMQALENSFEENERVMRIVSHDLRNPVGSIVSLALLLKANESLDDSAKEYSNMIHSLSKDVLGFMEEVLNLKTSLEVVDKSKEDLFELLSYCISFMEFKAQEKGQAITLSGQSVSVMVSREKIWRVFINILSNAIKFSPNNKSIEVYLEGNAKRALVSVTDHGIGIPDDLKDKVFDMLTEAKRNGTAGEKAHGLGMAISKQIMEAHGGKIWLESEEGKGTTFYLEFSREGVKDEPKEKPKQKPKETKGPRYSAKVV